MKCTQYFESVEAVNQYYPDGVPSTVIAIVGDGSNVFVSSDNAASGNQQYYSADMTNDEIVAEQVQAAEQQGYESGYADGQAAGGGEWMPIAEATLNKPLVVDLIEGTVDSIDLYWDWIQGDFSREAILDQETGDVLGYRFEWSEGTIEVPTGDTDPETGDPITVEKTVHVIHEEYPDPETGNYVSADDRSADRWFDFMIDNETGDVITDLYENVYPVLRNVTLEAAPQGVGYDYILRFETLASENDNSSSYGLVEPVTENGIYPVHSFCAFNVNVEGGGSTNWLDVLYLDEKTKAESFLDGTLDFYKYNFAKYATSVPFIEQQSALAFIYGLQNDSTMFKLIKITKDADGNAIITNNPCSINFDGQNVGAIALDGVTYYNKICVWGTLTLAAGDEVIMDCATKVTDPETGDMYALGLFGGFDDETTDPATYKCETAGTYTFGIWVDVPQVQDGQAVCFVSSMFNYEGSATVPAITVPTGETSGGGSSELTIAELNNMSMGAVLAALYSSGAEYIEMQTGDLDYLDSESAKTAMNATSLQFTVDKYNETDGLTIDYNATFDTDHDTYMKVEVSLVAGDKVGFSFTPADTDAMGDYDFGRCTWLFRYVDPENTGNGYNTHWFDAQNTGDYEFGITFGSDPESGDTRIEFYNFAKVDLR